MRTVLTVDPSGMIDPVTNAELFMMKIERHSANIPGMTHVRPLELAPLPAWGIPDGVVARGRLLRDALRKHVGVAAVLDSLGQAPVGAHAPFYVKLSEGDAELIAWETLCDVGDKFVALDRRWPIGRITDPASTRPRPAPLFRLPVRIMAVISAYGIAGEQREWEMIRDAADEARKAGLPVEVAVLTGDPAVHAQVTSDIAAARPWVSVSGLDASGAKVLAAIRRWQPNILHFFCHGRANQNEQELELAAASDFADAAATMGSVTISGDQLAAFGETLDNPWLLILNCCEGATASHDSLSLAHRVVSSAFPAAFAMLEPVDAADAHEFSRTIYVSLLTELATVKARLEKGEMVRFEWASITHDARDAINSLHAGKAASQREWALPALYVRGVDAMEFRAAPDDATDDLIGAQKAALDTVVVWLRSVKDSLSETRRYAAMAKALTQAGVPEALWPDIDGSFDGAAPGG
jgi:CHAT domain